MSVATRSASRHRPRRSRAAPARRNPAATRPRLVAAAIELFAERGLHAVTSAQIAARAGLATGTFYLYFADKLSLFRAIVFEGLAELRARQDVASAAHAPASEAELRARIGVFLAFAEERRALMRVLFARSGEATGIADEIVALLAPSIERRYLALQAAGRMSRAIHAGLAAQMRAAAVVRVAAWCADGPARASREEILTTLVRLDPVAAPELSPSDSRAPAKDPRT